MAGINYDDERFAENEEAKQKALEQNTDTYTGLIDESKNIYQQQIDASKDWAEKQQEIQQEQTDFTIEKIEQQKEEAEKAHKKEVAGAYQDYKKQTSQHGADAEEMAANGLMGTGYSESSKVSMYNTYQNRVALAKESVDKVFLEFNNAITEAKLQNNSVQAEIAYNAMQQQMQLIMAQFEYESGLKLEMNNQALNLENMYYGRYQDIVNQINTENAAAEAKRQYDEQFAYQKAQDERNYQLQLKQLAASSSKTSKKTSKEETPSETQINKAMAAYEKGTTYLANYLAVLEESGVSEAIVEALEDYVITNGKVNPYKGMAMGAIDLINGRWR